MQRGLLQKCSSCVQNKNWMQSKFDHCTLSLHQAKQAQFYLSYSAFTIQVTGKFKSAGKKQVVKELNIFAVGEKIIIGLLSNWVRSPKELTLLWNMAKV